MIRRRRRQQPRHMKPVPALPYSVIGLKPFRLPGEKRAWAKADERDAAGERKPTEEER